MRHRTLQFCRKTTVGSADTWKSQKVSFNSTKGLQQKPVWFMKLPLGRIVGCVLTYTFPIEPSSIDHDMLKNGISWGQRDVAGYDTVHAKTSPDIFRKSVE